MTEVSKDLKKEAEQLGIQVHHRWNEDTLVSKINERLADMYREQASQAAEENASETPSEADRGPETENTAPSMPKRKITAKKASQFAADSFARRRNRAASLVRCIIVSMDPNKRAWQGELFSVGSSKLGSFKKYIPYGKEWHVPRIMLDAMEEKRCSTFHNVPDGQGGMKKEAQQIKAYAIQELPPLTEQELKDLAISQARAAA